MKSCENLKTSLNVQAKKNFSILFDEFLWWIWFLAASMSFPKPQRDLEKSRIKTLFDENYAKFDWFLRLPSQKMGKTWEESKEKEMWWNSDISNRLFKRCWIYVKTLGCTKSKDNFTFTKSVSDFNFAYRFEIDMNYSRTVTFVQDTFNSYQNKNSEMQCLI